MLPSWTPGPDASPAARRSRRSSVFGELLRRARSALARRARRHWRRRRGRYLLAAAATASALLLLRALRGSPAISKPAVAAATAPQPAPARAASGAPPAPPGEWTSTEAEAPPGFAARPPPLEYPPPWEATAHR